MRLAVLTLEATVNARAVRRFVARHAADIALVGLSDPFRPETGGAIRQTWRRVRQSGPSLLPYLTVNFVLPRLLSVFAPATIDATPLARACPTRGIPVVAVADVNADAFRERLSASGAELLVTFHFDQILTEATIAALPFGGINIHPSILPRHRGPTPTIHALLDDPVELGVTVHRLAPRIDAGAILAQARIADRPGLTAIGAARLAHDAALPLLDALLPAIAAGRAEAMQVPPLPYRGFPTPAELRALARKGRSAAGWSDVGDALGRAPPV